MYRRLFVEHPKSVDESYGEHFMVAGRFGAIMIWGGLKAVAHAFIPGICVTSASDTVKKLYTILVEQRRLKGEDVSQMTTVDWII